jgi:RNA polymerase sigma-70 factor, ECF subfamily
VFYKRDNSNEEDAVGLVYADSLYSYSMVLTRNRAEAEDLVQETFYRAIEAAASFKAGTNRKGWLFTILRNAWLNKLREGRSSMEVSLVDVDIADVAIDESMSAEGRLERLEQQNRVRKAIQQLPVAFREMILLREFEELSYKEIANLLGCAQGTVMSRLARSRAALRTILASETDSISTAMYEAD